MIARLVAPLVIAGSVIAVACVDMSAPSGPASISELKLPSPTVVIGDTMRDSAGVVAPIRVIAFDANDQPIPGAPTELFITDTSTAAHLDALGTLIGDRFGSVNMLGQVNTLQTPGVTIPVTYRPAKLNSGTVTTLVAPVGDSTKKGNTVLNATVLSAKDSGSQGMRVEYELLQAPASRDPAFPAVYIGDDRSTPTTLDTTDASGDAQRRLWVVSTFLASDSLVAGKKDDSAVVAVRASYAGVPLNGSPFRYVIPIQVRLPAAPAVAATVRLRRPVVGDILAHLRSQRGSRWVRAVDPGIPRQAR